MTEKRFHFNNKIGEVLYGITADDRQELQNNYDDMMYFLEQNGFISENGQTVAPVQHAPYAGNGAAETESIEVEAIEYVGKNRWVVKGGWATKHGITVWPEVLEAAGLEGLPMDKEVKASPGWVATYTRKLKQDGSGLTADKVIRLEKVEADEFPLEPIEDIPF